MANPLTFFSPPGRTVVRTSPQSRICKGTAIELTGYEQNVMNRTSATCSLI